MFKKEIHWRLGVISILLLAAVLRLWMLDSKPAHFDEGVNGWFADQIRINGHFSYNPENFHGPWYFYLVHASQTLFGRNLWALRLPAILGSLLGVFLLLKFNRHIGRQAAALAALAMAVSPAFVFYGRYSIHESWFVAFNILALLGLLDLWIAGRRNGLYLLIAGATGMILTKETYIIHLGTLLLAFPCLLLWDHFVPPKPKEKHAPQLWSWDELCTALACALAAIVLFYSGFGRNWQDLHGLWQTHAEWFTTGVESEGGHAKEKYDLFVAPLNWYWVWLLANFEWPLLLGLLAGVRFFWPAPDRLRYIAIYAAGLFLAYSLIPYKTPWCLLALAWPLFLVLATAVDSLRGVFRTTAWAFALLAITGSLVRSIELNFYRYVDHSHPYVYVQTDAEIEKLTGPLFAQATADPQKYFLNGTILLESYYPLPWTLGDFPHIAYFGNDQKKWPEILDGDFVVIDGEDADIVRKRLDKNRSWIERSFHLRDGMKSAIVFFAKDAFPNEEAAP